MKLDNNQRAFFELLRAGLFPVHGERFKVNDSLFHNVDWEKVYQLAQEQSVQGIVLCGLEELRAKSLELRVPQMLLLQWIGEVQQIEQRNKEMNAFVAELIEKLRKAGIYALLVKGQGVAQCYEKPLWRCSGDVDLLLSNDNYPKAKSALIPIASEVADEDETAMHQALVINGFDVELHGKMPFSLSKRVEEGIDDVLNDLFCRGNVKSWDCNGTQVFLPSPDNDVILVFTHFLYHFFIEGVGLRQICDWCRLLYTYKDSLNYGLLESRIKAMGLMSEWKAFYNLASRYLGMPDLDSQDSQARMSDQRSSASFMFQDSSYDKKADRIMELVLKSGNFGHNKDLSYRTRYSGMTYKIVAAWRRLKDFASLIPVFPMDAPMFYLTYILGKVK